MILGSCSVCVRRSIAVRSAARQPAPGANLRGVPAARTCMPGGQAACGAARAAWAAAAASRSASKGIEDAPAEWRSRRRPRWRTAIRRPPRRRRTARCCSCSPSAPTAARRAASKAVRPFRAGPVSPARADRCAPPAGRGTQQQPLPRVAARTVSWSVLITSSVSKDCSALAANATTCVDARQPPVTPHATARGTHPAGAGHGASGQRDASEGGGASAGNRRANLARRRRRRGAQRQAADRGREGSGHGGGRRGVLVARRELPRAALALKFRTPRLCPWSPASLIARETLSALSYGFTACGRSWPAPRGGGRQRRGARARGAVAVRS